MLPACWRVAPGQRVHQRGLAGAVAPQQGQGLALAQGQRHIVQDHGLAVACAEAAPAATQPWAVSVVAKVHGRTCGSLAICCRASPSVSTAPLTSTVMRRCKAEHQIHVVFDQQHRHIRRQVGHGLQQFLALARRHTGHRFVEQQHAAARRPARSRSPAAGACRRPAPGWAGSSPRPGGTAPAICFAALGHRRLAPSGCHQRPPRPWCCDTVSASVCSGVSESNSWLIWKVRTMPRRARWCGASWVMSWPSSGCCRPWAPARRSAG
jgi:hypothetical protein